MIYDEKVKKDFLGFNLIGFFGIVEDRNDPLKLARVRVRAFGWHSENLDSVPTETLPWASVLQPSNSAMNSGIGMPATGLIEGSMVFGFFLDGEAAQRPMVIGSLPGIPQSFADTNEGFADPHGRYPSRIGESDLNRLARNESIKSTIVNNKVRNQRKNISIANNVTEWSQPDFAYNARYPYNQVWQTEGGNVIELDDSTGSERIHIYHKAGTFIEIDANGTKVEQIIGDNYEINERSKYLYVNGFNNIHINGDCNLTVANNYNLDVHGDFNLKVGGDFDIEVAGNNHVNIGEEYQIKSNNAIFHTKSNMDSTVNGELNTKVSEKYKITSDNEIHLNSPGNNRATPKNTTLNSPLERITLNEPVPLPFLATFNRDDLVTSFFDDLEVNGEQLTNEVDDQIRKEIILNSSNGIALNSDIKSSNEKGLTNTTIPLDTSFKFDQRFPDTFKLSDNFNLGDLSSRAVVSKYKVRKQHGLSKSDIVVNLKSIAENVLEPILDLYPDMIVTSGFRVGNTRSQHERGEAVDIQFRNKSKKDYFQIAERISTLIPSDQLLLEYKDTGTGLPWIHISHKANGNNRGQLFTFFNHRKRTNGLTNLV